MLKVFCGFSAFAALLGLVVMPPAMSNLWLDMAAIYLGMALIAAVLHLGALLVADARRA